MSSSEHINRKVKGIIEVFNTAAINPKITQKQISINW